MSLFARKAWVISLAAAMVCGLVGTTWALGRISAWIVYHDAVWLQMNKEGAVLEHAVAEAFFSATDRGVLVAVEAVCGLVFLVLLWHTLFRANPPPEN